MSQTPFTSRNGCTFSLPHPFYVSHVLCTDSIPSCRPLIQVVWSWVTRGSTGPLSQCRWTWTFVQWQTSPRTLDRLPSVSILSCTRYTPTSVQSFLVCSCWLNPIPQFLPESHPTGPHVISPTVRSSLNSPFVLCPVKDPWRSTNDVTCDFPLTTSLLQPFYPCPVVYFSRSTSWNCSRSVIDCCRRGDR